MDEIFEQYGQAILSVIAAGAIIGIVTIFMFGTVDPVTGVTHPGAFTEFIYKSLSSILR